MTGQQRTFELVPTTLVKQNASRPPMTSKAAKKAYQQAQRGPRISKAEQRRRDAEEYERIRKEHEKEKNAAKAKAARDKKAAKALAEKEARRKSGLPEPSRFVRASQPTISKFVRGDSSAKRSWKEMNSITEETEDLVSDSEGGEKDEALPLAKRITIEHESEDEFGEFPLLSPSALDKIESSAASLREEISTSPSPEKIQRHEITSNRSQPSQEIRTERTSGAEFEDNNTMDVVRTKLLFEAAEVASKEYASEPSALPPPPPVLEPQRLPGTELLGRPLDSNRFEGKTAESVTVPIPKNISKSNIRPVLQERLNRMPPPRLPVKKLSISFTSPLARPELSRQNNPSVPSRPIPSMQPSATQAFLEDHLDDFFPSPSQQDRELRDDIDDVPLNTQIAKEIRPQKAIFDNHSEYFICTQDFVLTPQDLEEIITPSRAQPNATKVALLDMKPPSLRPVSRDKPRFFEEKKEDLFQTALHESRPPSSGRARKQIPTVTPEANIPVWGQNKPQLRRFFTEKEEDVLKATLHESKVSATKHGKPSKANAPPLLRKESSTTDYGNPGLGGFFKDKEQKLLQAVIGESKKGVGLEMQDIPVKEPPKRTLKRVLSSATDYGDDEFSGCSQELLALC